MRKDKKRKNGKEMTEWNHWRNSEGLKIEINQRKETEETTNSQNQKEITEQNYEDSDTRGKKSLKTSRVKRDQEKRTLRSQTDRAIDRKKLKETRRNSITREIKIKRLEGRHEKPKPKGNNWTKLWISRDKKREVDENTHIQKLRGTKEKELKGTKKSDR